MFTGLKYGIRTDSVLNLLQFLTRYDVNASIDDVKYCFVNGIGEYQLSKVYNIFPTITLKRIVEYLDRVEMYQCINPKAAIEEWGDYLYAAQKLKMDLTDNKVKYPGSLRKEHDVCTFKWQTIQKANKLECFKETSEEIEQRYAYSTKDFFITVPHSYEELFEEGRKLSHCVGNYGDRILNRETNIVFLRKKENPTEPFYTIEISTQNKIVQIKGHHNYVPSVAREPEMMEFIEIWKDKKKIG